MAISEDDLRGLSAAEREALLAVDETDEDLVQELGTGAAAAPAPAAAPAAPAGEADETTEEEDAAAAEAAAADAPAPAPAPAAAAAPAADAGQAEGAAAEEEAEEVSLRRAAPEDIDDQRKALNAREDESMQKLLDGEITQAEHAATKNEVRAALDKLLVAEATDRAAENIERSAMLKDYNADLRETVKLGKAAGLDYTDETIGTQFDRAVRMFSKELSEQGVFDKPGNLANSKQALQEAHAYMLRRNGKAAPAPAAAGTAAAPAAPAKTARPAPDRSALPPTLAAVPTATDARITSEFAHLEGITEPAALERELAKLTPDQQERYLGA